MQSLHLWPEKHRNTPTKFGCKQLGSCKCVAKFKDETHEVIILVYVEDLVILSAELGVVK